jgi:hypothetical protein
MLMKTVRYRYKYEAIVNDADGNPTEVVASIKTNDRDEAEYFKQCYEYCFIISF